MSTPVDLSNLRTMTDGDSEMEKALFEEFYNSFEAGINVLGSSTEDSAAETWRKEAHALKGIALNLGATQLGALSKKAQDDYQAGQDAKVTLLASIRAEYERVRTFLTQLS